MDLYIVKLLEMFTRESDSNMVMMNYRAVANIITKFGNLLLLSYNLLELIQGVEFGGEYNTTVESIKKIMRSEGANV